MLKRSKPLKRRRKKKMSELTPRQQVARREKWAKERKLKEVDALSRDLAWLVWGNTCPWPLCKSNKKEIQWHHFITRDIWDVRWDPDNLIPLHDGCHRFGAHGKHSHLCIDIQLERLGQDRFDALMRKKNMSKIKRTMETLLDTEKYLREEIARRSNSL